MSILSSVYKKLYKKLFLRTNKKQIDYYRNLGVEIGEGVIFLSDESSFGSEPYLVSIGNNCLVSGGANFLTHDGGMWVLNNMGLKKKADKFGQIKIGNNVFIGLNVIVMPGVEIGDNCVIGTGSIVTKNVDSESVVAGVPARRICSIYEYNNKNQEKIDYTYGINPIKKKEYLMKKFKLNHKKEL